MLGIYGEKAQTSGGTDVSSALINFNQTYQSLMPSGCWHEAHLLALLDHTELSVLQGGGCSAAG
jgi:hypothetical protein